MSSPAFSLTAFGESLPIKGGAAEVILRDAVDMLNAWGVSPDDAGVYEAQMKLSADATDPVFPMFAASTKYMSASASQAAVDLINLHVAIIALSQVMQLYGKQALKFLQEKGKLPPGELQQLSNNLGTDAHYLHRYAVIAENIASKYGKSAAAYRRIRELAEKYTATVLASAKRDPTEAAPEMQQAIVKAAASNSGGAGVVQGWLFPIVIFLGLWQLSKKKKQEK